MGVAYREQRLYSSFSVISLNLNPKLCAGGKCCDEGEVILVKEQR